MFFVLSFLLPLFVVAFSGEALISFLKQIGFTQYIREEGPSAHQAKKFTPTAGGIIFLVVIPIVLILAFVFKHSTNLKDLLLPVFLLLGSAGIGFWDDYLKKVRRQNEGLKPKQKLLAQIFLTLVTTFWMERTETDVFSFKLNLTLWLFGVFIFFVLSGAMNAANLTDGLDGLASSVLGWSYLGLAALIHIKGLSTVSIAWSLALAGICFGFLRINGHPAKVFMGDTGSFFLGGGLGILALMNGLEWYLLPLMLLPIWEVLSVILQVASCKLSRKFLNKDLRPFKMTPYHHHLELSGWSEKKVVFAMSSLQAIINILLVLIIKFRF